MIRLTGMGGEKWRSSMMPAVITRAAGTRGARQMLRGTSASSAGREAVEGVVGVGETVVMIQRVNWGGKYLSFGDCRLSAPAWQARNRAHRKESCPLLLADLLAAMPRMFLRLMQGNPRLRVFVPVHRWRGAQPSANRAA